MKGEIWRYINKRSDNWAKYGYSLWLRRDISNSVCIEAPGDKSLLGCERSWIFSDDWFEKVNIKQESFHSLYSKLNS